MHILHCLDNSDSVINGYHELLLSLRDFDKCLYHKSHFGILHSHLFPSLNVVLLSKLHFSCRTKTASTEKLADFLSDFVTVLRRKKHLNKHATCFLVENVDRGKDIKRKEEQMKADADHHHHGINCKKRMKKNHFRNNFALFK
jgi:hypothetical protein